MLYLIASILCSVAVSVLLKLARSRKIDIEQAVAVNYIVAIVLCMLVLKPDLGAWKSYLPTWWLFAALGVLLPAVFVIMGRAVGRAGIVKSDAAQRLSLFLPVLASFALFGEQLSQGRLIGLALAFTALFCLLWKSEGGKKSGSFAANAGLLLGVWAGYGVIDILFKQVAKSGTAFAGNLLVAFCLAAVLMFGYLFSKSVKWTAAGILGGLVLGCLNFANIFTYVRAHQIMSSNPTLVFAGMNIGVIVLGTLVGALAFKEKISAVNAAGIVVAVCAIGCLFYWNTLAGWLGL
ncbi:EamA/RhaT family transporter [Neisseria dentiae]|uniref:EamA/RhaT family transporter n=1 Tax=Neisseria dentiae TaxID=194197 RepID=UPI0035A18CE3